MLLQGTIGTNLCQALLLLGIASAEQLRTFSDIYLEAKQRIGNGEIRYNAQRPGPEADPATFRFYKEDTSPFRVKSLPDIPFSVGEMYSGLMPIKAGDTSRQLFFIFQPTIGPPTDSLTIWLNGGPGCSSLEGFFQENGRFVWHEGKLAPTINDHSWVNVTNMLWVEQPVGTGYTVGTPTAKSEEDIARDFLGFFKNFQQTFSIKNFKIYVTGESYAGRYCPYISAAMLDQKDKEYFDLKGMMVYDPCIGAYDTIQQQVPTLPFIQANNDVFGFEDDTIEEMAALHESCGFKGLLDKYLAFPPPGHQPANVRPNNWGCDVFTRAQYEIMSSNTCFDVYMVNKTCPKGADPIKGNAQQPAYFNRPDVKAALHAPAATRWAMCNNRRVFAGPRGSGPEREGDLSADPIQGVLPQVIQATNRVLVANGDYDMIIITNGTLLSIQNMTWNGQLGFQKAPTTPINIPGLPTAGVQHYERGLMWSEAFKTGHMGPEWAPELAYRHIEWLLGTIDSL